MNSYAIHNDIRKFIKSLIEEDQDKVTKAIELLQIREYHIEMPFSRKIGRNLYELRVGGSKNIRIFYTFHQNNIVLLHIIGKKRNKIAKKDINTAINRMGFLQ